jgi:hypothetical protein
MGPTVGPERKLGRLNSISEKRWVDINGIEQGMFIESQNDANPVLLVVHGGPGMPDHFLTKRYPTGLEELFTVVWWEQRGTGLSYRADIPAETMTVDQFVADTSLVPVSVTSFMKKKLASCISAATVSSVCSQAAASSGSTYSGRGRRTSPYSAMSSSSIPSPSRIRRTSASGPSLMTTTTSSS